MSILSRPRQLSLTLKTWGGKRAHAGRKPNAPRRMVSHHPRPTLTCSTPVHVTVRLRPEVRDLRTKQTYRVIASALAAGAGRFGLRVVHHSVQSTHIHLIAEAADARALSRGMQGLSIRIARRVNALSRRHGKVVADRYHVHVLRTPREVRYALQYVLNNARKHAARRGASYPMTWLDPYSSAAAFDGWEGQGASSATGDPAPPYLPPQGWLLRLGWRRHGLLRIWAVPSRAPTSMSSERKRT